MENQELVPVLSRQEKIRKLLGLMNDGLLERHEQTKLILLAALSGEHVLLLGPPGTAKSELAKRLKSVFVEANYFERLLTRFSVPEELFGPLSIQALEEDKYKRLTSGYLPEASVAFIDEIFKANSAILNSLLTLLNERQFDNGNRRYSVPLISVIAASNELPEGEELDALYDRFMLRSFVKPVTNESFVDLLQLNNVEFNPDLSTRLKMDDLLEIQKLSEKVHLSKSVIGLCNEFRDHLNKENIYVSDRRWRKIIKLMKVSAFSSGFDQVSNYDAWLLPHCLWQKPEQLKGLQDIYKKSVAIEGDFSSKRVVSILSALKDVFEKEISSQEQFNEHGQALYVDEKGNLTTDRVISVHKEDNRGRPLYKCRYRGTVTPESDYGDNKPIIEEILNKRYVKAAAYSQAHISSRVEQANELVDSIEKHIDRLDKRLEGVDSIFHKHLWVDPMLRPDISECLSLAKEGSLRLLEEARSLVSSFESLPCEGDILANIDMISDDAEAIEGEVCE